MFALCRQFLLLYFNKFWDIIKPDGVLMMVLFLYFLVVLLIVLDVYLFARHVTYVLCAFFWRQVPFMASNKKLRHAVAHQISQYYPNARTAVEIGCGYGGMARYVSRKCAVRTVGLENIWFTSVVARVCDFLSRADSKTIRCNAFEYMERDGEKFDIALAYMGPCFMSRIYDFCARRSRVLISLDFPVPGVQPTRQIDVSEGGTRYNGVVYPHRLYVYEF